MFPQRFAIRFAIRWKRLQLDQRARLGIILALFLLVVVPAYVAFRTFQAPTSVAYRVPVWGWAHWGEWDYSVFLKPNTLYEDRVLGSGLTYYEALVERIEARFSYTFATDTTARIEGWYEVTADLVAGDQLSERALVVPRTPFVEEQGSSLSLGLAFPVDRAAYRARVQQLTAETGLRAGASPTVTYVAHIETTARAGGESTSQTLEPRLVVPLSGETFNIAIAGERSLDRNGVIRRTEEQPVPGLAARRAYALLATGAVALLPLVFALATASRPPPFDPAQDRRVGPLEREARRLLRRYRKRIVLARPGSAALPGQEEVPLASIHDLLQVSNELLKPIVYHRHANPGHNHLFYVVDGPTRYQYRLSVAGEQ